MVTTPHSATNCATRHSRGSHTFTHTLTSTQLQPLSTKIQLNYYKSWNHILFWRYLREGEQPEYPEKTPDSLPANWYHILLLDRKKIQIPRQESNLNPPTLVISLFPGQKHAPRLTHCATDRCRKIQCDEFRQILRVCSMNTGVDKRQKWEDNHKFSQIQLDPSLL